MTTSAPNCFARSKRNSGAPITMIFPAPRNLANTVQHNPTGPLPYSDINYHFPIKSPFGKRLTWITTVSPIRKVVRSMAWNAVGSPHPPSTNQISVRINRHSILYQKCRSREWLILVDEGSWPQAWGRYIHSNHPAVLVHLNRWYHTLSFDQSDRHRLEKDMKSEEGAGINLFGQRVEAFATRQCQHCPHVSWTSRNATTSPTTKDWPFMSDTSPFISCILPTLTWPGMIG